MPTAKNEVKLKFGTKAKYTSATKNADTVYFITDTNQIFVGSSLVSSKCYYVTDSPVESNYGVGDVVVWKLSDNAANICVVNSSGQFDTFTISIPKDEISANTNARHSHKNKAILDAISGTPVQVTSQTLTDEQKTQARTNIGALGTVVPNPTSDNDAANKAYVDSKVASGGVTVDPSLSYTSTNPVQNKVVKAAINGKSSVTIKSWTADDVGGVDVTLTSGTYTFKEGVNAFSGMSSYLPSVNNKVIIDLNSYSDDIVSISPVGLSVVLGKTIGFGYNGSIANIIVGKPGGVSFSGDSIPSVSTSNLPRWVAEGSGGNETMYLQKKDLSTMDVGIEINIYEDIQLTQEQSNIFNHFFIQ